MAVVCNPIMMGRCSELMVVCVCHSDDVIREDYANDTYGELGSEVPNDTTYKRWSCHSGRRLLFKLCRTFPPPVMGPDLPFLGMRTRWNAGAAAHKSG